MGKGGARTNIAGAFHAGDVEDRVYRQTITASCIGSCSSLSETTEGSIK